VRAVRRMKRAKEGAGLLKLIYVGGDEEVNSRRKAGVERESATNGLIHSLTLLKRDDIHTCLGYIL
jgi:hypothetical protein